MKIMILALCLALCLAALPAAASHTAAAGTPPCGYDPVKTLILQVKNAMQTDRDSLPILIRRTEMMADTTANAPLAALLHSMTAEMYHIFYLQNRHAAARRTPIGGYIPDDLREWTTNLFTQKIHDELAASLRPAGLLRRTPASILPDDVLQKGADAPTLRPMLYDFLAHRALEIQPSDSIYLELIRFRRSQPDRKATLMAELDYLRFRHADDVPDSLFTLHDGQDYSVEIAAARLASLKKKRLQATNPDSIRTLEYNLCREMIRHYPSYPRIGLIQNHLAGLEEKELRVMHSHTIYPGKNLLMELHSNNLPEMTIHIRRIPPDASPQPAVEKEITLPLPMTNTYTPCDTTIRIPMKEPGKYEYQITSRGTPLRLTGSFRVSRLAVVARPGAQQTDILVADFLSGKPLPGATVHCGSATTTTNADGLAHIPAANETPTCTVRLAGDEMTLRPADAIIYANGDPGAATVVSLFTDRGIYRPGQTIFFKAIAYADDKENTRLLTGKRIEITLRDPDGNETATRSFTTNSYGSFSGEFTLPAQTKTGYFTLSAANISAVSLRVEEYRRPTFHIDLPPIQEEIAFGDEITLRGTARTFSGVPLAGGTVVYRILCRPLRFLPFHGIRREQVAEGETTISSSGNFTIAFRAGENTRTAIPNFLSYEIIILATDSKGETQEARTSIPVADRSIILSAALPPRADKDTTIIRITAQNLRGETLPCEGLYAISTLAGTGTEGAYTEGSTLRQGRFTAGNPLPPGLLAQLPSGRMRLRLSAADRKGRQVTAQHDFILYSSADKRPPVFADTWLLPTPDECAPGEEITLRFGTSHKNVYLLCELFADGTKTLSRRRMKLSNANITLRIPFPGDGANDLTASFTFIKDGRLHTQQTTILRKRPDRTLAIRPEVFRDTLQPGSRESWTFRITGADRRPAPAEVLAAMYDASLDPIQPFAWEFSPATYPSPRRRGFQDSEALRRRYASDILSAPEVKTPPFSFDRLGWQGAFDVLQRGNVLYSMSPEARVAADDLSGATLPPPAPIPVRLRSGFQETAFFFPALQTDSEGNTLLRFTLPESNTTWKLQILAHTPDLKYAISSHRIITQKPLMTLPNLPRFIRQGDEVNLPAQLINLSGKDTQGNARLEVFDPSTGALILPAALRHFTLPAGATTTVAWPLTLPGDIGQVGIRITAGSEAGSDGEQHLLPVLPDKILLTESTPFYLSGAREEEKQIKIPSPPPSPTLQPHRMTLEFSNSPLWYAVRALPAISEPDSDNAISLFASSYAGTLSAFIARSDPRIRDLIDLNQTSYRSETAMRELLRQQHEEGGWGWFGGFRPSPGITLYILEGMAQLSALNAAAYSPQEKEMQARAIRYLDREIAEEYNRQQKSGALRNHLPTPLQVQYLYVRSAYRGIPSDAGASDAIRYYTGQLERHWTECSLYEKGEAALLMQRNGKEKLAGDILNWLRKTAVTSPEKGMYWPNNRDGRDFFRSPTDVHCLLMTVFRTLNATTAETDRLKQWLLNRKQTQAWESTPSTANAIFCLLNSGSNWLEDTNEATIRWGDKTFHTSQSSAGKADVGYIRDSVNAKDLTPALHTVTLHRKGKSPAWGAVFCQYFESIAKVNKQGAAAMSIEKKLFTETNKGGQRHIIPLNADRPLKVGDKVIVRLTLRTDRDMDYVSLQDLRSGCLEPALQRSGLMYADGLICYHSPKDASENFFFEHLPQGTRVLEYAAYVSRSGRYNGGIATLQCLYAPEFAAHTEGNIIRVDE
jgi:hypothetical protein